MSEPFSFPSTLTVCIDFKSPQAYLAKDPVCALLDELDVTADWQPLLVPPLKRPAVERGGDDRGTRHRRFRARYVERDIQRYARSRGLTIADIHADVDSSVAAIGLLWCKAGAPSTVRSYIDRVFDGFWERGCDIARVEVVGDLLAQSGAKTDGFPCFVQSEGAQQLGGLQRSLAAAGVLLVPALVVRQESAEPETFLGRAHLPMVRWLLDGKRGHAPI